MQGPVTVTLTELTALPAFTLPTGALPHETPVDQTYVYFRGEVVVPRAALTGTAGYWVRASLYDLATGNDWGATAAFNDNLMEVCNGTTPPGPTATSFSAPEVGVTLDPADRSLTTDGSFLVDPGHDPDGDGLAQSFEDAAIEKLNPVIEFDEAEDFLAHPDQLPAATLAHVRPWPSYADVQYVLFEFLPTFALDGGVGITFEGWGDDWSRVAYEAHRGDSEKVFLAYEVVDDQNLTFAGAYTSAHHGETCHDGAWEPTGETCNTANRAVIDLGSLSRYEETEQMCGTLEFDDAGRIVVYPSRNKHAMYPSKATCEAATLVVLRTTATGWNPFSWYALPTELITGGYVETYFNETCGYDPLFDRTYDDDRHLGDGRWRLDAFNVGEPGNWLIDDLGAAGGLFPNEHVWTGRVTAASNADFCGGLDTEMGDYVYPEACSGRPGAKYDAPPDGLLDLLAGG